MRTTGSRTLAIGLGLMLGMAGPSRQVGADEPTVFPDIQRILDAGFIRVAIRARDAAPMIMTDEDGALAGSEPDLARWIDLYLGDHVGKLDDSEIVQRYLDWDSDSE